VEEANKERDSWKNRLETIRKERDSLLDKLQHQPEKIIYRDKQAAAVSDMPVEEGMMDENGAPVAATSQGDEYWAKVLQQKAQLMVELDKAKAELDNSALQVAELRKENSDFQLQIKDLNNDKVEIENRLTNEKKRLEDSYTREKQELQRRIKDGEDLASNLSMEAARARGDQKNANDFGSKIKDDNVQMQANIKQLISTKVALEKTVARLTQEKNEMGKRLNDTEGVIQNRINEIWQIKQTLDQKITQINQAKSDKEVELPPIVVNNSNGASSAFSEVQGGTHKIISINAKNNFVIIDYGQSQGSSIGRIFKAYRDDKEVGTLEVIQVRRDISAADIKNQSSNLQVGDQVR
jgi:DNA repair exonuclease SbcCD ATPase subunit